MIAKVKRLGDKRWRASVCDDRTTWYFEWDQQRKQWMLVRASGESNRDPRIKPLIMEALTREWQKCLAELILE